MTVTKNKSHEASEAVLSKIRKLLELTKSPNEHEAKIAVIKAQDYLTRYNLSVEEVMAHDPGAEVRSEVVHKEFYCKLIGSRQPFDWCIDLAKEIADSMYCSVLFQKRYRTLVFIGRSVNVDASMELFDWLYSQIYEMANQASKARVKPEAHGIVYRNSFITGMTERLCDEVSQSKWAARQVDNKVTSLAINCDAENKDYVSKQWNKVRMVSLGGRRQYDSRGYKDGSDAAKNVDMQKPKGSVAKSDLKRLTGR